MRLVVTGTPGTGKTTIAQRLAEALRLKYVNLNEELIKRGVCRYNPDIASYEIVDIEKAESIIDNIIISHENAVFDTLIIELVNPNLIDWVIVLRLNPYYLFDRLKRERKWRGKKLCENVLAEILDYFLIEAIGSVGKGKVIEIDTTGKSIDEVLHEIIYCINTKKSQCGIVDWLSLVDPEFLIKLDLCRDGKLDL